MPESDNNSIITQSGFEELKRIYDSEAKRKENLDSKAATVLGFASLVVTLLLFILKFFLDNIEDITQIYVYGTLISISMLILAISLICFIIAFQIRDYQTPIAYDDPDILFPYLTIQPLEKFEEKMVDQYIECITVNYSKNETKATFLKVAVILLAVGVLFTLVSPFVVFWMQNWRF